MHLINTEHTFSFYNNLLSAQEPDDEFDINHLIEVIRYGYIKKEIKTLRNLDNKEKYYLDEYNIEIDSACKDIARCMLLSYDPNIYCNPFSDVYAELYMPEIKVVPEKHHNINYKIDVNSSNTIDVIENLTLGIEKDSIDITNGYENWIRIGFSLATSLGESGRGYFHRLSRFNEGYRPQDCDKKFTQLLTTNNESIKLGTLIYIARINGIKVIFPSHKNKKPTLTISNDLKIDKSSLYESLRNKRLELANKSGRPAFTVFTNKTLDDLLEKMPKTEVEFLNIYGISQNKCDAYAKDFLPLIVNFTGSDAQINKPLFQKYIIPKLKNKEESLFQELRDFRLDYALERGLKAFHVFGNTTLHEMVSSKPKTKAELLDVKGIGERRLEQFGDRVLEIITKYAS